MQIPDSFWLRYFPPQPCWPPLGNWETNVESFSGRIEASLSPTRAPGRLGTRPGDPLLSIRWSWGLTRLQLPSGKSPGQLGEEMPRQSQEAERWFKRPPARPGSTTLVFRDVLPPPPGPGAPPCSLPSDAAPLLTPCPAELAG